MNFGTVTRNFLLEFSDSCGEEKITPIEIEPLKVDVNTDLALDEYAAPD